MERKYTEVDPKQANILPGAIWFPFTPEFKRTAQAPDRRLSSDLSNQREKSLTSLEAILEGNDEDEFSLKLKQYFAAREGIPREIYLTFKFALTRLESRNPKMAEIIRKRYQEGKTLREIGDEYRDTRENIRQIESRALRILKGILLGRIRSDLTIPLPRRGKKRTEDSDAGKV